MGSDIIEISQKSGLPRLCDHCAGTRAVHWYDFQFFHADICLHCIDWDYPKIPEEEEYFSKIQVTPTITHIRGIVWGKDIIEADSTSGEIESGII
jgi:hypothetical protein